MQLFKNQLRERLCLLSVNGCVYMRKGKYRGFSQITISLLGLELTIQPRIL